ncbi:MAG: hypothetical protein IT440_04505 [Phycisphaeraceae bacterium]|nr:hypothetical protein [Phycisphaeraceae bacterium]
MLTIIWGDRGKSTHIVIRFLLLAFLYCLPLTCLCYGQEVATSADSAEVESPSSDATSSASTESVAKADDKEDGQMALAASGDGGGGGQSGGPSSASGPSSILNYQTDLFTGRFSYQVPIFVAPARQGTQPTLAIGYNSSGGNGWCGVGWTLDVGSIQRDTREGVPVGWNGATPNSAYDDSKGFVANFGGSSTRLVNVGGQNYRAEVDQSFTRYVYDGTSWIATDRNGNTYWFGETSGSRMENTKTGWTAGAGQSTFRWCLSRMRDINGNETTYSYTIDTGMRYLSSISYNANVNAPAISGTHTVDFILESRTDKIISLQSGYRVEVNKRLKEIVNKVGNDKVVRYVLDYTYSTSTYRSLLHSLTLYGSNDTSTLPPTIFSYSETEKGFESLSDWLGASNQSFTDGARNGIRVLCTSAVTSWVDVVDMDGDGLPDRIAQKTPGPPYDTYWAVYRNTGTQFVPAFPNFCQSSPIESNNDPGSYCTSAIWWKHPSNGRYRVVLTDVNRDGLPDRVLHYVDSASEPYKVQINSGCPGPNGFLTPMQQWLPLLCETGPQNYTKIRYESSYCMVVDFFDINGDGYPDRVMEKYNVPYDRFKVQLGTGSGLSATMIDWAPLNSQGQTDWTLSTPVGNNSLLQFSCMADMNGDGLTDRVMRK